MENEEMRMARVAKKPPKKQVSRTPSLSVTIEANGEQRKVVPIATDPIIAVNLIKFYVMC